MNDKERGTYSPPTEDNLSYEARRPSAKEQAPITLIISGIFLVVLLIVVLLFYNSGLNKSGGSAPDVGDSVADIKEAQIEDARPLSDQDLLEPSVDGANATFAPSAEAPSRENTTEAPPPAAPIQGPLPSQTDNVAITGAQLKPPVQAITPQATPAAAEAPAKPAGGAGTVVQIGAFDSQETANREYANVASSYGLFVGGTSKRVEKVETARGTFYRTSFAGFASAEKARSFCAALKDAGRDCLVK